MPKIFTKDSTYNDEVLAGAARYDIKENGGAAFKSNMDIILATAVSVAGTSLSAARLNNLNNGLDAVDTKLADASDLFTTGGSSTAFTITTTGVAALATGEKFRVKFHATAGATPTLNRDSKGAKSLKFYDNAGAKQACDATVIVANMIADIVYDGTDYVVLDLSIVGLKTYFDTLYTVVSERVISGPAGFGDNYVITPSVSSNNLTIAMKGINGSDPSASNPLRFRIGNTVYTVTAATSFTKNAATNWCNLGSAELAALPHDLFMYAIGETGASAGIKFGFSRISHAKTMGDFVNTSTNEKYIAGNWTNFNSTDAVQNIGRFRAQLSAGAGYTWSIPSALVVNRPIYESGWLSWTPAGSGSASMTFTSVSVDEAVYQITPEKLSYVYRLSGTTGGTASNQLLGTLPFNCASAGQFPAAGSAAVNDGGGNLTGTAFLDTNSPTRVIIQKYDASNYGLGAGRVIRSTGAYRI